MNETKTLQDWIDKVNEKLWPIVSSPPSPSAQPYIYIVSSALANLPSPGNRVGPGDASKMPKLFTNNTSPVIKFDESAHHYRFVGIEVSTTISGTFSLINLGYDGVGNDIVSPAKLPTDIIFDRCYIHGIPTGNLQRCILLNAARSAVIDSHISDAHWNGADAQAICSWNGPGPFKIVNNYLEGSGENVMFGGADPAIQNLVPSDIEMRRNHFFKPLTWKIGDPSYAGIPWTVKNLLELKNASRILIEGNLFEQNWAHAQVGYALQLTVRNQDGTAPWSTLEDVTFRHNIVRHSASGINILGFDPTFPSGSQQTKRIKISNNLFADIGGTQWGGGGRLFEVLYGAADVVIEHNTAFQTSNIITAEGDPMTGFIYRDNITPHNNYGVIGTDYGVGNSSLNQYFPGAIFNKNILISPPDYRYQYPTDNFWSDISNIGFTDYVGGNYTLTATSPYHNAGSDGKDIGADFAMLNETVLYSKDGQWGSEPTTYSINATTGIPLTFLDTTYKSQNGSTIFVNSAETFQVALNTCKLGDTIVVDVNGTYVGNFIASAK